MKLWKSATDTYNLIQQVYGVEALSRARVFQWHKCFRERVETTEDVARSDRLSAMPTPKNVERFRDLLKRNCQITVRMFSELLYISKTACHKILHEDLGKRKLKAGLIPHSLTHCEQEEDCSTICADLV